MENLKILIFGQSFNSNTGGGITLSNLFCDWNKDDLAVLCTSHALGNISEGICDNYYFIGSEENSWIFPFKYLQRSSPSGNLPFSQFTSSKTFLQKPGLRSQVVNRIFYPFLQWSGLVHVISQIKLTSSLINWVKNFNPNVIYIQVSTRESLKFGLLLSQRLKIPFVVHQMDDWMASIGYNGFMGNYWKKKIEGEFKNLVQHADCCMSISDLMGKDYEQRFGKKFVTFHNPVDLDKWYPIRNENKNKSKTISILYAGRTGFGIGSSLKSFAAAVELFNKKSEREVNFFIQTLEELSWVRSFKHTFYKELIPYDQLPHLFQNVDLLLLPCDFSGKAIRFLRLSMPTKAPEYMISGTPILVLAPKETAIFQYSNDFGWAFTSESDEVDHLVNVLEMILKNDVNQFNTTQRAMSLAKERHSGPVVRSKFLNEFLKIVDNKEPSYGIDIKSKSLI
ncbi:hypothetical protein U3A58_19705 [Algoriphagus sp. C2-6-M1]|uniref:hypothetical protein n=1 Tax=Algoriphagus persicinus TaxID=3108754 RepID=UPI002B3A06AC|nr:hypothetical protein [Algoriphagus sp. C2-6-M1]MEB2782624.1 hypothetical protein [Algoriphagus sp. C2-6-M1]